MGDFVKEAFQVYRGTPFVSSYDVVSDVPDRVVLTPVASDSGFAVSGGALSRLSVTQSV